MNDIVKYDGKWRRSQTYYSRINDCCAMGTKDNLKTSQVNTCLNGSESRASDPNGCGPKFNAHWGNILFWFHLVKPPMPILSILCVFEKLELVARKPYQEGGPPSFWREEVGYILSTTRHGQDTAWAVCRLRFSRKRTLLFCLIWYPNKV